MSETGAIALPRAISLDPYRFEDPTFLEVPQDVGGRARPGAPKESGPFWEGLRAGSVMIQRCDECERYTYYPAGGCQWCGGRLHYEEMDAAATVNTFAPCYLSFGPGLEPPYLVAIVNPVCEPRLQIMTNLVNCRICDIRIGMPVRPLVTKSLLFYQPV